MTLIPMLVSVILRLALPLRGFPSAMIPQSSLVRAMDWYPMDLSLWHRRREENLSPWEVTLST